MISANMKLTSIEENRGVKARMTDKELSPVDDTQAYSQFFLEYSIMAEYNQLKHENLPGIYVIPSAKSSLVWFGVLFIQKGVYEGGVFKFTLSIPENYPDGDSPRITFDSPMYHPSVSPTTGQLDVCRAFPKWRRNVNHLSHVLLYTRKVFHKIDTDFPWNIEAAKLYVEQPEEFRQKVSDCVRESDARLNDGPKTDDPREIVFSEWNEATHENFYTDMVHTVEGTVQSNAVQRRGLSWMRPGSTDIFTVDNDLSKP